ncbi:penicillin-binding protein 1C [Pleionea sediminis]|uniref:penicillin-binding protein 1C n=1 Tax=Pleionea sediminis TaxID=2569479 RepID=UPI0013DE575A|nr:penicillin-binding protein 1C [Pleionea sediminis]
MAFCVFSLVALSVTLFILDKLHPLRLPSDSDSFAQVVTDEYGRPLRAFADRNGVWRYPVTVQDVSPIYLQSLVNYEDRWFYLHHGVNAGALVRAIGQWLYYGKPVSGGSTITMQVARILYPHKKSISGKLHQILRAMQLEWYLTKQEILELYLNYAPFGGPIEGVQAASFTYLGKSVKELTHAEAALLTVLPQAPSRYRPDRHVDSAKLARDKVIKRMYELNVWNQRTVEESFIEPVIAQYNSAPRFAPLFSQRMIQKFPNQQLIQTYIDRDLQRSLEHLLRNYITSFPKKTSASLVLLDNDSMAVKAYLGTADFANRDRFGHIDMVQAVRSPGSTLKPFLYGLAIDEGLIHEQSMLLDVPLDFNGYQPENFTRGFSGVVSARQALQRSLNVPAVQILDAYTPKLFYSHVLNAGMSLQLPNMAEPNLSMILGGVGGRLDNLTQMYASFGREGKTKDIQWIKNQKENFNIERKMMSQSAAWIIGNIMREVPLDISSRHAVFESPIKRKIAFKTGTSFGFRDAWVFAVSDKLTLGIWIGRPDGTPLNDNYGRRNAVPLLRQVLQILPQSKLTVVKKPQSVTQHSVCWPLGTLEQLQNKSWCLKKLSAWLKNDQAPMSLPEPGRRKSASIIKKIQLNSHNRRVSAQCNDVVKSMQEIALWPDRAEPWLPLHWRREVMLPPLSKACSSYDRDHQLQILGVDNDNILYPTPGADTVIALNVKLLGGRGYANWFLNGKWVGKTNSPEDELKMTLSLAGEQHLSVMDESGQQASVHFDVGR